MRQQNKPRSRHKNSGNRRSMGNAVNRVFDSSGPEGKVRGTPQQIIEKYMSLFRDAQLSGDRVAAENFQQHAEHYTRILLEALKEQSEKKEQQDAHAASRRVERAETESVHLQNGLDTIEKNKIEKKSSGSNEGAEEVAEKET